DRDLGERVPFVGERDNHALALQRSDRAARHPDEGSRRRVPLARRGSASGTRSLERKSHMTNDLALAYDPLDESVQSNPYPYYAALREQAPVYWLESLQSFVVSRHEDVRRVMHDHETFSSEAMGALVSRPVEYADAADALDEVDRADFPKSIV